MKSYNWKNFIFFSVGIAFLSSCQSGISNEDLHVKLKKYEREVIKAIDHKDCKSFDLYIDSLHHPSNALTDQNTKDWSYTSNQDGKNWLDRNVGEELTYKHYWEIIYDALSSKGLEEMDCE